MWFRWEWFFISVPDLPELAVWFLFGHCSNSSSLLCIHSYLLLLYCPFNLILLSSRAYFPNNRCYFSICSFIMLLDLYLIIHSCYTVYILALLRRYILLFYTIIFFFAKPTVILCCCYFVQYIPLYVVILFIQYYMLYYYC